MAAVNGVLVFLANDGERGPEIWSLPWAALYTVLRERPGSPIRRVRRAAQAILAGRNRR
jgi:hypothetical protein